MNTVKVTDVLDFMGLIPNVPVSSVLQINGVALCYSYSNSVTPAGASIVRRGLADFDEDEFYKVQTIVSSSATPNCTDRTNMYNHRVPDPLPQDFLKAWKYKPDAIERIRSLEKELDAFTRFYNRLPIFLGDTLSSKKYGHKNGYRNKKKKELQVEEELHEILVAGFKARYESSSH